MKTLLAFILIIIPIAAFSQGFSEYQGADFDAKTDLEYKFDPFRSFMLQADNSCKDKRLIAVASESNELTVEGPRNLNSKEDVCHDFLKKIEESRLQSREVNGKPGYDTKPDLTKYIYITGPLAILAAAIVLLVD